ncbi:uncharacterized protein V1516DRAFT_672326 [Lipomyces oligophaga]|uniref:uncharacterized protein n=1 Tax=Lipomyces oligophaga TaxID=45792 RepID=UPI0034CEED74
MDSRNSPPERNSVDGIVEIDSDRTDTKTRRRSVTSTTKVVTSPRKISGILNSGRTGAHRKSVARKLNEDAFEEFERSAIEESHTTPVTSHELSIPKSYESGIPRVDLLSNHTCMPQKSRDINETAPPRLGFGQTQNTELNISSSNKISTDRTTTHLSSDEYFSRLDDTSNREEIRRLHSEFDSAQGISSDAYFGRSSEDQSSGDSTYPQDVLSKARDMASEIAQRAPGFVGDLATGNLDVNSVRGYLGRSASQFSDRLWNGSGKR